MKPIGLRWAQKLDEVGPVVLAWGLLEQQHGQRVVIEEFVLMFPIGRCQLEGVANFARGDKCLGELCVFLWLSRTPF